MVADGVTPPEGATRAPRTAESGTKVITKTLSILELVAQRGGATPKEISEALSIPMPTVYRILGALVESDYVVHLRAEQRYELGYRLHRLGVSLHRQVGLPSAVRREVASLHRRLGAAAYFAAYRGHDVILAYVDDCPKHPKIELLDFGVNEASHATAFGKIMLAGMDASERDRYLDHRPMTAFTPHTISDRGGLDVQLSELDIRGFAWEHEEFIAGTTCAAAAVRDVTGLVIGSVAVSAPSAVFTGQAQKVEAELRASASVLNRWFRTNRAETQ